MTEHFIFSLVTFNIICEAIKMYMLCIISHHITTRYTELGIYSIPTLCGLCAIYHIDLCFS